MQNSLKVFSSNYGVGMFSILYGVGIFGYLNHIQWIIDLTPYNLLLSGIFIFIQNQFSKKNLFILLSIIILGFGVEVLGVNSGFPFGEYTYQNVLGFKFCNVPIVMGLNWYIIIYSAVSISSKIFDNQWVISIATGILCVVLDFFIEPVAIHYNYWQWKLNSPPIENFISWGIVSFILSLLLLSINKEKFISKKFYNWMFFLQLIFFIIVYLFQLK